MTGEQRNNLLVLGYVKAGPVAKLGGETIHDRAEEAVVACILPVGPHQHVVHHAHTSNSHEYVDGPTCEGIYCAVPHVCRALKTSCPFTQL